VYHQSDGKKVIEVQFDFEDIAIPEHLKTEKLEKNSVLQTLILFPKSDGSYVPYFLNIYPDSPDKKFKLKDFMDGGYQKIPSDFSGVYRFYRWNGDFISGWRVKDGVKTHRIKESKNLKVNESDKSARTSNFQLYCYVIETTWYQFSCSETFGCTSPVNIGTTINGVECELVFAPAAPGDSGGGGGGGGTPPSTGTECEQPEGNLQGVTVECDEEEEEEEEVFTIENNVQNICIRGPVQQAITQDFKTQISDIILDIFGSSENISVYIDDVDYLSNDIDGTTFSGMNGTFPNFTIELNRNILQNSSKEYIMATIFHEFLHAYIIYLDEMEISTQSEQHQQMVDDYVSMLSQTLQNIYGISQLDALHLSWGGLHDSNSWQQKSTSFKNDVISTNQKYRSGNKGSKCAPLL
jgi:hypothetical protein